MPRELLPTTDAAADTANNPNTPAPAAHATPIVAAQPLPGDALAGALPAWDLLPGTPFVRRVK